MCVCVYVYICIYFNLLCYFSFGYCDKVEINGHKPVGHYGNGFKSGSMRLGRDAIVFSRSNNFMSCGFLSQTYLESIGAETVLVPIVSWNLETSILLFWFV